MERRSVDFRLGELTALGEYWSIGNKTKPNTLSLCYPRTVYHSHYGNIRLVGCEKMGPFLPWKISGIVFFYGVS